MENHIYDIDREAEAHGWENAQPNANFDLIVAKESILPTVQGFIDTLVQGVDNGEINALEVFATFKKLEKVFDESKRKVEEQAQKEASNYDKNFKVAGVEFTQKEGSKTLQYSEDFLIVELTDKIKQRQELIKVATISKEPIYDQNGIEVTKVSIKSSKSILAVKFK